MEKSRREDLKRIIVENLKGNYYCDRVWSAWSYGTMTEDDFSPSEESDSIDDFADDILTLFEPKLEISDIKVILRYLNDAKRKMTGNQSLTGYRETTAVKRMINARLKEKFSVEDFKKVIDHKAIIWKGSKMAEYLRPSTLFSATHFSEYLCESESYIKPSESKPNQEKDKRSSFDRLQEKYGR